MRNGPPTLTEKRKEPPHGSKVRHVGEALANTEAVSRVGFPGGAEQGSGIRQVQALAIMQRVFDGIVETLAGQGRIELRNFAVFEVKRRKPRQAHNPRTGERVSVPPKVVVTFKPGRAMEQRVRGLKNGAPEGGEGD
jgi:nucleoid DNA-binding protein